MPQLVAETTEVAEQTVATVPLRARLTTGPAIVFYIALAKFAIHLYAARFYGYFGDELYFIACSRHLAWGYVDQPPLIAVIVGIARLLFGDSLQSIRFPAALAGVCTVLLAGWIADRLCQGVPGVAAEHAAANRHPGHERRRYRRSPVEFPRRFQ